MQITFWPHTLFLERNAPKVELAALVLNRNPYISHEICAHLTRGSDDMVLLDKFHWFSCRLRGSHRASASSDSRDPAGGSWSPGPLTTYSVTTTPTPPSCTPPSLWRTRRNSPRHGRRPTEDPPVSARPTRTLLLKTSLHIYTVFCIIVFRSYCFRFNTDFKKEDIGIFLNIFCVDQPACGVIRNILTIYVIKIDI